jgi:phospholipid/cholesterol/gamma-HCH transport system substrate-binding protein
MFPRKPVPDQQQVRWSQLKVGVLVIVALTALAALIFLMSGNTGGFWSGHLTLRSYFENSAGLKLGAPVNLEGVTVGNVKNILIDPARKLTPVEVVMYVNRIKAKDIRADARSSLTQVGVLGDTVVDIDNRGATGPPVANFAELPTTETPDLQDVIQASQGTIQQLDTILTKVNTIADALSTDKGSIGALINDKTVYNKGLATLNELSALVDKVSSGQGSIGKLVYDDSLYNDLKSATKGLNDIVTEVNSGKGSAGKLLKDDSLYNNMNQATKNLNDILANINAGKGSLGVLAKDPEFADKLKDTVTRLDSILTQVDNGQGTIGALMKDRKLYDHTDQVMQSTSDLITAIRKDPKKYLSIKLKIF